MQAAVGCAEAQLELKDYPRGQDRYTVNSCSPNGLHHFMKKNGIVKKATALMRLREQI